MKEEETYEFYREQTLLLTEEYKKLKERIDKAIKYIEEYCIDDEFYINLTKKEKNIIYALKILKEKMSNDKLL